MRTRAPRSDWMNDGTPAVFFIGQGFLQFGHFRVPVKPRSNWQVPHLSAARQNAIEPNHPGDPGAGRDVTFADACATRYSQSCPTAAGSFRGNEPLATFSGQDSLGTWRLAVENNGSDNFIGYVRGFTVTITGTAENTKPITGPNAVYNAAGFQSGTVAPGEMVNIQGANLGPTTGTGAPTGDLPTSLGGVSVTFDGVPAALSYVSADVL